MHAEINTRYFNGVAFHFGHLIILPPCLWGGVSQSGKDFHE